MSKEHLDVCHNNKGSWLKRYGVSLVLVATFVFIALVRVRLLSVPLERDEGEYAYAGQLILQGIPPYEQVYNMKLPGIYAVYAVILAVFGQSHQGIHLGLLVVNLSSIMFVYLLGKRLFNPFVAAFSALAFGLLSLSESAHGFVANAEHFVILPALAGFWLLLRAMASDRLWTLAGSGVLLGLSFVIKQHGAAFVLFGGAAWCVHSFTRKPFQLKKSCMTTGILFLATAAPFGVTCLIMWVTGVFGKFWFWTFDYAREYASAMPLEHAGHLFLSVASSVMRSAAPLWIAAGLGIMGLFTSRMSKSNRMMMPGFVLFSFLAICPGFYFRPHYFLFLMPAAGLLAGNGFDQLRRYFHRYSSNKAKFVPMFLIAGTLASMIYQQRSYYFTWDGFQISRFVYGMNPFPESIPVARYLEEHTAKADCIAVIGSEPQIYFYSKRRSATGYIYMYPLMETHPFAQKMQEEMMQEIITRQPEYLIMINFFYSWTIQPGAKMDIFNRIRSYGKSHYHRVGVVEINEHQRPIGVWDEKAKDVKPATNDFIMVYKRNKGPLAD